MLKILLTRRSRRLVRSSNSVCGAISGTVTVRVPPARSRPSEGKTSAVVAM